MALVTSPTHLQHLRFMTPWSLLALSIYLFMLSLVLFRTEHLYISLGCTMKRVVVHYYKVAWILSFFWRPYWPGCAATDLVAKIEKQTNSKMLTIHGTLRCWLFSTFHSKLFFDLLCLWPVSPVRFSLQTSKPWQCHEFAAWPERILFNR